MKHNLIFSIIVAFIIASSCHAMETTTHAIELIKELPLLYSKSYMTFLTNNEIMVQDKEELNIIDSNTYKTIATLPHTPCLAQVRIHPNRKVFMLFNTEKIKTYDTETKEQISEYISDRSIISAHFNPLNDHSLYIMKVLDKEHSSLEHRNYRSHVISENLCVKGHAFFVHPTKPVLGIFNYQKMIKILPWDKIEDVRSTKLPIHPSDIFYSPDGSIILAHNPEAILTINASTLEMEKFFPITREGQAFRDVKFHPNSTLLTILMHYYRKNKVQLQGLNSADLPSAQDPLPNLFSLFSRYSFESEKIDLSDNNFSYRFEFSPDGEQCMLTLNNFIQENKGLIFSVSQNKK